MTGQSYRFRSRLGAALKAVLRRYLDYIYFDMVHKRVAAQVSHARTPNVDVLLDLGCHTGENTARLADLLQPRVTVGLEYSPTSILQAKTRAIAAARSDLNQLLPFPDEFADVVLAYDVLEHLVETWQAVCEVYRVLKPGGVFMIDCPNLAAWHNVFALILGYQPTSGPHLISIADSDLRVVEQMHRRDHKLDECARLAQDELSASKMHRHIVIPTYKSLLSVLVKAGFEIEGSWAFGYYPLPPLISDWMCRVDPGHAHHFLIRARKPTA